MRVERPHHHATDAENRRGKQHHAHQCNDLRLGCQVERGSDHRPHQPRRKEDTQHADRHEDDDEDVDNGGGKLPRRVGLIVRQSRRKQRDERGAQRPTSHDEEDRFRDALMQQSKHPSARRCRSSDQRQSGAPTPTRDSRQTPPSPKRRRVRLVVGSFPSRKSVYGQKGCRSYHG